MRFARSRMRFAELPRMILAFFILSYKNPCAAAQKKDDLRSARGRLRTAPRCAEFFFCSAAVIAAPSAASPSSPPKQPPHQPASSPPTRPRRKPQDAPILANMGLRRAPGGLRGSPKTAQHVFRQMASRWPQMLAWSGVASLPPLTLIGLRPGYVV